MGDRLQFSSSLVRLEFTQRIDEACRPTGATTVINGRVDIARSLALGVHLPESGLDVTSAREILGSNVPIGRSTHDLVGVNAACDAGADLITLSPVFATPGKPAPIGLAPLRAAARQIDGRARLIGLGGITAANLEVVLSCGVDGVAAIRAAWDAGPARQRLVAAIAAAK